MKKTEDTTQTQTQTQTDTDTDTGTGTDNNKANRVRGNARCTVNIS
jgi:hypothetical protein